MTPVAPPPHRPPLVRVLNAVGRVVSRVGPPLPALDVASLHEAAAERTGLVDFGGDDYREGLDVLLDSLEAEAKTSLLGRVSARRQIVDLLATRLALAAYRRAHPSIDSEPIERPVFVLGLPRTGSSLLHALLALDPASRSPSSWEVARPVPPPEARTYGVDSRIASADADLARLRKMVPHIDAIHPMGATRPQECVVLSAPSFRSFQFQLSFDVPTYHAWYMKADLAPSYRFHRRFLEHLQSRFRCDRWVLKSPAHLGHIDALLAEYPDACIVQTHRDPVDVIPSVSSLHHAIRGVGSDAIDPAMVGIQQSRLWASFLERAREARARHDASRFIDVRFDDLVSDPIAVVARIYAHFRLPMSAETETRMRRHLSAHPRDEHGRHRYTPEMFGLTAAGLQRDFHTYRSQFGFDAPRA